MKIFSCYFIALVIVLVVSDSSRAQTWNWAGQIASYSTGGDPYNRVTGVAIAPGENVFIIGNFGDSVAIGGTKLNAHVIGDDMFLAKYNSAGTFAWARSFGSATFTDNAFDVTCDQDGNAYVCGYFTGTLILDTIQLNAVSISNVAVAKYNSSGAVVWARLVWHANSGPGGILFDHGHIYAAVNHTLAKYTPDGDTVWTRTAPDNVAVPVEYDDIAADSAGNLYLTGSFTGVATFGATTFHAASITDIDIVTVKYDKDGNISWARQAGAVAANPTQADVGHAITVSHTGEVFVAGQYKGKAFFGADSIMSGNSSTAMFVADYADNGDLRWVKGANGANLSSSNAYGVAALPDDDILVEGTHSFRVNVADTFFANPGGSEVLMLRLGPNGEFRWGKHSDTPIPVIWGYGLAVNADGSAAYAGGQFSTSAKFGSTIMTTAYSTALDGWVAKMAVNNPTDVGDGDNQTLPKTSILSQNYPNPFNPTTTISFDLPKTSRTRLEIFNIEGQVIRTLVDAARAAGHYSITWDGTNDRGEHVSSGMYFYRLKSDGVAETKKMVLLK